MCKVVTYNEYIIIVERKRKTLTAKGRIRLCYFCVEILIERSGCKGMEQSQEKCARLRFSGAVVSDRGLQRKNNEDNYILDGIINPNFAESSRAVSADSNARWHMAGVFDGMGGGEAGELAALYCAQAFRGSFARLCAASTREQVDFWMRQSFQEANNAIVKLRKQCRIFGSTATVMCTDGAAFKIYHLGDSRAYLAREQALLQLTRDQTLAQLKLDVGICLPDAPCLKADRHKLTEYVGRDKTGQRLLPVESCWIPAQPGDSLLLCSDGLYGMCEEDIIAERFFEETDCGKRVDALLHCGISEGGADNITCVAISFY